MRSRDRRIPWGFLAAFAAATMAQGVGAKLAVQLVNGTVPPAGLLGLVILIAAYAFLVTGLIRMLRRQSPADGRAGGGTRGL